MQQILLQMPQLFYYKMRQKFITKCVNSFYCKMRQFYYKMRQLLPNAKILLQNETVISKCEVCYKIYQYIEELKERHKLQNWSFDKENI